MSDNSKVSSTEEAFSLEKSLTEIRAIVDQMQKGVSDFDQQLALFGKGNELIKQCQQYLDESELKIKQLVEGNVEDIDLDL